MFRNFVNRFSFGSSAAAVGSAAFGLTTVASAKSASKDDAPNPLIIMGEIGDETTHLRLMTAPAPHYEQFRTGKVAKNELVMHTGRNLHSYLKQGEMVMEVECENAKFENFNDMVSEFVTQAETARNGRNIIAAAFSTSGPVDDYTQSVVYDRSTAFSIARQAWGGVDGEAIANVLRLPSEKVAIVNDIAAAGLGTLSLHEDETFVLQDGVVRPHGPIALLYAGDGLGEAFLTWAGTKYVANASEGGHAEFSPKTALEVELLGHMKKKLAKRYAKSKKRSNRVSVERVTTTKGICDVYDFMAGRFPAEVDSVLHEKIMAAERGSARSEVIASNAMHGRHNALCRWAMDVFGSTLGGEAGDMALKFMPRGGVYIMGDIPAKNVQVMSSRRVKTMSNGEKMRLGFMAAFLDKGRMARVLEELPVKIVLANDMGKRGTHLTALRLAYDAEPADDSWHDVHG
jgi:glucokinase